MTINQYISEYLSVQNFTGKSAKTYETALNSFFNWCIRTGVNVNNLTVKDVVRYNSFLRESDKRQNTIFFYTTVLKLFFKWRAENYGFPNIGTGLKNKRPPYNFIRHPLTLDESVKLLNDIDQTDKRGKRDYAVIKLMLSSGLRCIEVSRLIIADIVQEHGQSGLMVRGKGKIDKEFVHITSECLAAIENYLAVVYPGNEKEPIFRRVYESDAVRPLNAAMVGKIVSTRLTASGLKSRNITPHSLRHTAGSLLSKSGMDTYDIQRYMRHTSLKVTEVYIKQVDQQRFESKKPHEFLEKLFASKENNQIPKGC